MINYIPNHNIRIEKMFTEQKFIMDKICDVLFSGEYNSYCLKMARSILDFLNKTNIITPKQAQLLMKLKK